MSDEVPIDRAARIAALSPEQKRTLLRELLAPKADESSAPTHPLSFAQERLWFLDRLHPGRQAYAIPAAIALTGRLDPDRLRECLTEILARHEVLRTRFVANAEGHPRQIIDPPREFELTVHDVADTRAPTVAAHLSSISEAPFDLARGPLLRASLLRASPEHFVLLLCVHHIIADYWSLRVLMREIAALYVAKRDGREAALAPLGIQYLDYAVWQREQEPRLARQLSEWREALADMPALLDLPTDFPRPPHQSFRGARHEFTVPEALSAGLRELAKRQRSTLFATLLAGLQALLFRYSGQRDFAIGTTATNRDRAELHDLIGLFANNLVLRARPDAETPFTDLIAAAQRTTLAALSRQEVPFERVVEALDPERSLSHNALFQVMFVLHNTPVSAVQLPGLEARALPVEVDAARFDLSFDLVDDGGALSGFVEYNTDLFRAASVDRLVNRFLRILTAAVADPTQRIGHIELLDDADRATLAAWNDTASPIPEPCVHRIIEARAAADGRRVALRSGRRTLTYEEMNVRANRLAHHLVRHGAGPGTTVAIALRRGLELPLTMLATLKSGARYLPLDPLHPAPRLRSMLEDVGEGLLVHAGGDPVAPAGWTRIDIDARRDAILEEADDNLPDTAGPDDHAYVIFTSGSTGRPKGVPIRHESLANLLTAMVQRPGIGRDDVLLAVTTVAFDIATLELLAPLIPGACVVIADETETHDAEALARRMREERVTLMQATPATWRLLVEDGWSPSESFTCLCGGEALAIDLARALLGSGGALWNLYGPTETTIWSGAIEVTEARVQEGVIPIGGPVANTGLHVLDAGGSVAPPGVCGELCISGAGLSPGYHRRESLTGKRFVEIRDVDGTPTRVYRTGDRVSRRDDGSFVFRGRLDHQLKLRGYRIEPAEIEAVLADHPAVAAAVVLLVEGADPHLFAFCTVASLDATSEGATREWVARRLPAYMVPAAVFRLESLPLTPNGKVDREALLAIAGRRDGVTSPGGATRPLRTESEYRIAAIWTDLLGRPIADAAADFFSIGGHSLLAARLASRIEAEFGVDLPVREVFEQRTLTGLASVVDRACREAPGSPRRAAIPRRDPDAPPVLSAAQYRQWVIARLEPDNPYYNIPAAVRLRRTLDPDRVRRSLARLVARHDVLHTAYRTVDDLPCVELVEPAMPEVRFERLEDADEEAASALLREFAAQPFDLARPPLLRALVVDTGDVGPLVLLVLHHIVGDARSLQILFEEWVLLYGLRETDVAAPSAPPPLTYLDYAAWERARDVGDALAYWRSQLAGIPPLLELPTDYPRPPAQGFSAGEHRFHVPATVTARLALVAQERGATMFMVLLAALDALLHRFSGANDIVVGCPVGHRPRPELERVVGLFVNTLAIRARPRGDRSFGELLDEVRDATLGAFAHQHAPFDQVVNELDLPRSWAHSPVFQVMFQWEPEPDRLTGSGGTPSSRPYDPVALPVRTTKVDLTLAMSAAPDGGLAGRFDFRDDLFHPESVAALTDAFTVLLSGVAADPTRRLATLPILSAERAAMLADWNATGVDIPTASALHERFELCAKTDPDATALIAPDATLSYSALNARANRVAHALIARGVGPGSRVGVCLPRRAALISTILGTLKSGAAYVPLDPEYPQERIQTIIEDADLAVLIADRPTFTRLSDARCPTLSIEDLDPAPMTDPPRRSRPSDLAYILYTSGSTGTPKGVAIEHRSPIALVQWAQREYPPERLAGVLAATSVCFDLSVFEIFVPLSTGGRVILADHALALPELPARDQVTLINTVPTVAAELVRRRAIPPDVTTVNVAGEPLSSALVRDLYASGAVDRVYNLYGPTEDTTYSTVARLDVDEPAAFAPIGRPIANTRAYVLDDERRQVAPGFPGELHLAGAGVARGYLNRPALTAERFVPEPFEARGAGPTPEHRGIMYATGDRVRVRHDGQLTFLGRLDHQIKLRGFRIEPGEVEAVLERHAAVQQAVVGVWRGGASDHPQLVAWLVLVDDAAHEPGTLPAASAFVETLRGLIASKLPAYMLPSLFVVLETLPLLPNGKVARQALPAPVAEPRTAPDATPASELEERVTSLFRRVLPRSRIDRHDNFFSLGGDSILALRLAGMAREQGLALTPRDIFQSPTVVRLAAALESRDALSVPHEAVVGEVPLTPIQRWFFEQPLAHPDFWNQALLLDVDRALDPEQLEQALRQLMAQHDALRSTFLRDGDGWHRRVAPVDDGPPPLHQLRGARDELQTLIAKTASELQRGFDLQTGPLWAVATFEFGDGDDTARRLLLIFHHLLVDGVSWRILVSDLQTLLLQLHRAGPATLPPASTPASRWAEVLARRPVDAAEIDDWIAVDGDPAPPLPLDDPEGENRMRDTETLTQVLDRVTTRRLLRELPDAHRVDLDELLLAALARALAPWHGHERMRVELEGHGRPDLDLAVDLSRTVGWLTTLYPVNIETDLSDPERAIRLVRSALGAIPHRGLDYGVLRYLQDAQRPAASAPIRFNYLGQSDPLFDGSWFAPARESIGPLRHPDDPRGPAFDINALVTGGELKLHWSYSRRQFRDATVAALVEAWRREVTTLLEHCLGAGHLGGYVEADFPQMDFAPGELDDLLNKISS